MITQFQQQIYNIFLKNLRRGKPFKYRKNFNNLSTNDEYYLTRLEIFFKQFPQIDLNDYFYSPYEVLDCNGYYDLKFYNTLKAKSCYSNYIKNKRLTNDITLDELKNSLIFLNNFCKQNNINVKNYLEYKSGTNFIFLKHFKENKIHLFVLFGFSNFENIIKQIDNEILTFMFGDLFNNINQLRVNFYNSKYKDAIKKAISKLS